jgi:hypothetical protein
MKNLIIAIIIISSSMAKAGDYCVDLSGGARAVMHVRQLGIDARTQHDIADQTMLGEDASIMHAIIKDAYTQPVLANKTKAEQDFAVYWMIKCMRAHKGFY